MTGPEHYAEAERLLREHVAIANHGLYTITPTGLTMAHIHAALALAAATALAQPQSGLTAHTGPDRAAWAEVAGADQGGRGR
jgi:ribulose-5-phosphate 4-epimerase/fuculose-1-phosphate aldolase